MVTKVRIVIRAMLIITAMLAMALSAHSWKPASTPEPDKAEAVKGINSHLRAQIIQEVVTDAADYPLTPHESYLAVLNDIMRLDAEEVGSKSFDEDITKLVDDLKAMRWMVSQQKDWSAI
jgi:hypothetical protein